MFRIGAFYLREELILIARPPSVGENFDFVKSLETRRLHHPANAFQIDTALSHESAIVQQVDRWCCPITDMEREEPILGS